MSDRIQADEVIEFHLSCGLIKPEQESNSAELYEGEARIIIESWRRFYNALRPNGSIGYRPPAPEVFIPATTRAVAQSQPASPTALAPKPSMH